MISFFSAAKPRVSDEWLEKVHARQRAAREYAERIERAVEDAGFDCKMLTDLPPAYVAAALVLGVK